MNENRFCGFSSGFAYKILIPEIFQNKFLLKNVIEKIGLRITQSHERARKVNSRSSHVRDGQITYRQVCILDSKSSFDLMLF